MSIARGPDKSQAPSERRVRTKRSGAAHAVEPRGQPQAPPIAHPASRNLHLASAIFKLSKNIREGQMVCEASIKLVPIPDPASRILNRSAKLNFPPVAASGIRWALICSALAPTRLATATTAGYDIQRCPEVKDTPLRNGLTNHAPAYGLRRRRRRFPARPPVRIPNLDLARH